MIDLIADGLKTAFNISEEDYINDESSSNYSQQESEESFEKENSCLSTNISTNDRFQTVYMRNNVTRRIIGKTNNNRIISRQSLSDDSCSGSILATESRVWYSEYEVPTRDQESEPTNYPESSCNDSSRIEIVSTKLEEQLQEFDRTFRNLYSSFSRKHVATNFDKDEYAARLIEAIVQTVKRSFEQVKVNEK